MWNKDEVKGKSEQAKGSVKQVVGHATNDRELEAKGQKQKVSGKIQEDCGTAKRKIGEAVEDIGRSIKH